MINNNNRNNNKYDKDSQRYFWVMKGYSIVFWELSNSQFIEYVEKCRCTIDLWGKQLLVIDTGIKIEQQLL